MIQKKVFTFVLAIALALSMSAVSFANEVDTPVDPVDPSPYLYTNSASAGCNVSGGTATASVEVQGKTGVTKIVVNYSLQKKSGNSWSGVSGAAWSKTVNSKKLSASGSKSVASGYTYRTKAVVTVYKGSLSETFTVYSGTVSY